MPRMRGFKIRQPDPIHCDAVFLECENEGSDDWFESRVPQNEAGHALAEFSPKRGQEHWTCSEDSSGAIDVGLASCHVQTECDRGDEVR
jgi:hypothetical protein